MSVFEAMRMSLSYPVISDDLLGAVGPIISRTDYLEKVLSEKREFYYRGSLYVYVPLSVEDRASNIRYGYLGKKTFTYENSGPEHLFALNKAIKWNASLVLFDISTGEQLIFAQKRGVGSSRLIIEELFNTQQKKFSRAWHTDIEYISSSNSFHRVADKFNGRITHLKFVFNPANGLNGFDEFKRLDKLMQHESNSEKSEYMLQNKEGGINTEGDMIHEAAEYASEGAGKIIMKSGRKTIYNSSRSRIEVEVDPAQVPNKGALDGFLMLFKHLKQSYLERKND